MFWKNGKPDPNRYQEEHPGDRHIERKELGDLDKSEWPKGLDGKPEDPWKFTKHLYLLDLETAADVTFVSNTVGGIIAVQDLCRAIDRHQTRFRTNALPEIELAWTQMATDYGPKPRPLFKVIFSAPSAEPEIEPPPRPQLDRSRAASLSSGRAASPPPGDIDDDSRF
jgi:hypothetical protein